MPIIPVEYKYKTITCDGPGCDKTVTFEDGTNALQKLANELDWFKTLRMVQNASGRNFVYHNDECEIAGVATGAHNPEERKQIIIPTGANAQAQAAAEAQRQIEINKTLKTGGPVTING